MRKICFRWISGWCGALLLCAQPVHPQAPSFKADVELVRVLATVTDGKGRLVTTLEKGDFRLHDEGQLTQITYFANRSDLPLTVGLLIDTSLSQTEVLEPERKAGYQFLDQVLRPDRDEAFLIGFDIEVELLQDMTGSLESLEAGLAELEIPEGRGPRGVGTVLFDSVFLAADEVLSAEVQRKALILISDGVDFGSMTTLGAAVEAAQRNECIIFSIRYYDSGSYRGSSGGRGRRPGKSGGRRKRGPDGVQVLSMLAEETGGAYYEVSKKLSLEAIFDQIQEQLRSQYLIGFAPPKIADQGYRQITLETARGDLDVRARMGYYVR